MDQHLWYQKHSKYWYNSWNWSWNETTSTNVNVTLSEWSNTIEVRSKNIAWTWPVSSIEYTLDTINLAPNTWTVWTFDAWWVWCKNKINSSRCSLKFKRNYKWSL